MPEPRPSLMEPKIEALTERTGAKFTLVTLASRRARQINSYFNRLGEGLGAIVPPQVNAISHKPVSIAMQEIAAGKIEAAPLEEADAGEETDAS